MNNGVVAVAASLRRRRANRESGMALLQAGRPVAAGEEKGWCPWERIIVSCRGCRRRDERWNTGRERSIVIAAAAGRNELGSWYHFLMDVQWSFLLQQTGKVLICLVLDVAESLFG